jgi:hypothetical protein
MVAVRHDAAAEVFLELHGAGLGDKGEKQILRGCGSR